LNAEQAQAAVTSTLGVDLVLADAGQKTVIGQCASLDVPVIEI